MILCRDRASVLVCAILVPWVVVLFLSHDEFTRARRACELWGRRRVSGLAKACELGSSTYLGQHSSSLLNSHTWVNPPREVG